MTGRFTREQAADAVEIATGERDATALSTDPLAFWQPSGQVTMSGLDELHERLATLVSLGDQGPQP